MLPLPTISNVPGNAGDNINKHNAIATMAVLLTVMIISAANIKASI